MAGAFSVFSDIRNKRTISLMTMSTEPVRLSMALTYRCARRAVSLAPREGQYIGLGCPSLRPAPENAGTVTNQHSQNVYWRLYSSSSSSSSTSNRSLLSHLPHSTSSIEPNNSKQNAAKGLPNPRRRLDLHFPHPPPQVPQPDLHRHIHDRPR